MDIFSRFATDATKETQGVRHNLDDKTVVTVARWGNEGASNLFRVLRDRHQVALNSTDTKLVDKVSMDNLVEVMANHILVGWEGIEFKGKPLEYSTSNAAMLLRLNDFRDLIFNLSRDAENYRYDAVEKSEKNSSAG
jgi:hypothetical protein